MTVDIRGRISRSWHVLTLAAIVGWFAIEPAPRAATRPPKLDYKMSTLENGLKVVLLEDHSTPIIHTEIWYHVGSKNEKKGRTGFAHLFEHMMFKGSKNVEPEGHPSRISSVGGQSNAYTNEDATVYWQTFPSSICRSCCGSKPIAWRRSASTRRCSGPSARS
jgi:hypothetical protein